MVIFCKNEVILEGVLLLCIFLFIFKFLARELVFNFNRLQRH